MKVKGIVRKDDPKRKLKVGDVIELSTSEKGKIAVEEAIKEMNSTKEKNFYMTGSISEVNCQILGKKGDLFHGKYSNNSYKVDAKVDIRVLDKEKERLKKTMSKKITVHFSDCLDSINQPDLKVDKTSLT